ncbi:MAG: hypothetical protein IPH44_11005 [Myxococcales bacterium]|nr:hypothetical protein [Myxococcales bacterium]MBK7196067.1 hypothetical protein [Myxococcales bacterium]MBP6847087.1 hypothetical protein [Kofleriaceae bacterium]
MRKPLVLSLSLGGVLVASLFARDARAACSKIECGSNSPYLAQYDFHELNFKGLPNDEGLIVTGLESPLVWWTQLYPQVEADHLTAVDADGNVWLHGAMLGGATITVIDSAAEPRKFEMRIQAVYGGFDLWVDPAGEQLESYKLSWKEAGAPPQDFRPVCTLPPPQLLNDGQEWYPDPDGTILFTGDRYSAEQKTVYDIDPHSTAGWVNWACPGGALYKLYMTRHTTKSAGPLHETNEKQRTAMFKLYVSDVCGDGHAFTKQGTPLRWTNEKDWGFVTWNEYDTEAYWGPEGALCLNVHRLGAMFAKEIEEACHLPSCDAAFPGAPGHWPDNAYVVSRLPVKPI